VEITKNLGYGGEEIEDEIERVKRALNVVLLPNMKDNLQFAYSERELSDLAKYGTILLGVDGNPNYYEFVSFFVEQREPSFREFSDFNLDDQGITILNLSEYRHQDQKLKPSSSKKKLKTSSSESRDPESSEESEESKEGGEEETREEDPKQVVATPEPGVDVKKEPEVDVKKEPVGDVAFEKEPEGDVAFEILW
jgi:hypothetical protein